MKFGLRAFEYSVRGYSVIPLRRNKLPLIASWKPYQTNAANDAQIQKWWKENPSANIGIITGRISGITVVDIDMKGGKELADKHLALFPKTYTVKTPTGGYHLYYQYDKRIQQTANTFPQYPFVDIRNDGGYVVAPPSFCDYIKDKVRTAGTYKVIEHVVPAVFPFDFFKKADGKTYTSVSDLLKGVKLMQDGDGRNNTLTKITGKILVLVQKDDWDTVGLEMIHAVNKRFKQPLPAREVDTIFNSISKRESRKPFHELDLIKNDKGAPIANEKNVHTIFINDEKLRDCVRFNIFTGLVETIFDHAYFQSYERDDVTQIRLYMMKEYPFLMRVSAQTVEDIMVRVAKEHSVSPPAEWLKSLVWDKKPRLDTWLCSTYGVEKNEYHAKVGANWLKGLVKRLVHPGCKFDYVLVIEGDQGIRKSTSFQVLGGDWHVETTLTPDNKDFFMIFGGKAIVEFSEGETLSRTEAKRLKAVITIQTDKYRVPYDRSPHEFPRQCVFAMTTNQEEYLKDETGNRRWLPVACVGVVNIDWLKENREQLYAEAYHRVIGLQETVYEFPEEATKAEQAKRQIGDPRLDAVFTWYFTVLTDTQREEGITTQDAFIGGVQKNQPFMREMTKADAMILGSMLRSNLLLKKKRALHGALQQWRYFPTDESKRMMPEESEMTREMKMNLDWNNTDK